MYRVQRCARVCSQNSENENCVKMSKGLLETENSVKECKGWSRNGDERERLHRVLSKSRTECRNAKGIVRQDISFCNSSKVVVYLCFSHGSDVKIRIFLFLNGQNLFVIVRTAHKLTIRFKWMRHQVRLQQLSNIELDYADPDDNSRPG